jgi:competence CoiA-like predicted nuclease
MLTRAFDQNRQWCEASESLNGIDFFCPECSQKLRVRHSELKRSHFYHFLGSDLTCRHQGVGLAHRYCQFRIQSSWAKPCLMEYWFGSIGRIADLYMPLDSLVIEIQYSSITLQEVINRTEDYKSLGLEIIWIFHFDTYINHPLVQSLVFAHYFTTIDANDCGEIVDICDDLIRNLDVKSLVYTASDWSASPFSIEKDVVKILWQRHFLWSCCLKGDWLDQFKTEALIL